MSSPIASRLVTICGAFGYLSLILQWLWTILLFAPSILENEWFKAVFLPQASTPQEPVAAPSQPSIFLTIIAVLITVCVLVATVVILVRLPAAVARSGKKATTKTAEAAIPLITHHAPISPKTKLRLTAQLVRIIKLIMALLPVILLSAGTLVELPLPLELSVFIGCILAIGSLVWFSLEYLLARAFGIKPWRVA